MNSFADNKGMEVNRLAPILFYQQVAVRPHQGESLPLRAASNKKPKSTRPPLPIFWGSPTARLFLESLNEKAHGRPLNPRRLRTDCVKHLFYALDANLPTTDEVGTKNEPTYYGTLILEVAKHLTPDDVRRMDAFVLHTHQNITNLARDVAGMNPIETDDHNLKLNRNYAYRRVARTLQIFGVENTVKMVNQDRSSLIRIMAYFTGPEELSNLMKFARENRIKNGALMNKILNPGKFSSLRVANLYERFSAVMRKL